MPNLKARLEGRRSANRGEVCCSLNCPRVEQAQAGQRDSSHRSVRIPTLRRISLMAARSSIQPHPATHYIQQAKTMRCASSAGWRFPECRVRVACSSCAVYKGDNQTRAATQHRVTGRACTRRLTGTLTTRADAATPPCWNQTITEAGKVQHACCSLRASRKYRGRVLETRRRKTQQRPPP